jgi:hypothetical protein
MYVNRNNSFYAFGFYIVNIFLEREFLSHAPVDRVVSTLPTELGEDEENWEDDEFVSYNPAVKMDEECLFQ